MHLPDSLRNLQIEVKPYWQSKRRLYYFMSVVPSRFVTQLIVCNASILSIIAPWHFIKNSNAAPARLVLQFTNWNKPKSERRRIYFISVKASVRFGVYLIDFNATTILTKCVPSFNFTICSIYQLCYTTSNCNATNILL